MESDTAFFKRRLSLIEPSSNDRIISHRLHLRNKYYDYLRKSQQGKTNQKSISPSSEEKGQTICSTKFEGDQSMPSIRQLREHRHEVGEMLRQTICRYNYIKHEQEKKQQFMMRKKKKYEKVLKIRQQNHKQKMLLTKSRAFNERQIYEEKCSLKRSVDLEKMTLGQSMIKCLNQKKNMGDSVRYEEKINHSRIEEEKSEVFKSKKRLHNAVKSEQKKFKAVMGKVFEQKKRFVTEFNLGRLERQIDMMKVLDKQNKKTNFRLTMEIKNLQKSQKVFDTRIKSYSQTLKDGDEVRKRNEMRFTKKIHLNRDNLSENKSMSMSLKRYAEEDDFDQ